MDYFNEKRGRFDSPGPQVPDYMPKNGLLYYDDLAGKKPNAITGQAYREILTGTGDDPSDIDGLEYTVVGGKRCLYKGTFQNNYLQFDFPTGRIQWTMGCWVYDVLGECEKQYAIAHDIANGDGVYLSFRNIDGNSRQIISVRNYVKSTGKTRMAWADGCYEQGAWHFLYAWQGSGYWGVRFDDRNGGENLGVDPHAPQDIKQVRLLPTQAYGIAIRGAFMYSRVLSREECLAIYNGSKDET